MFILIRVECSYRLRKAKQGNRYVYELLVLANVFRNEFNLVDVLVVGCGV